MSIIRYLNLLKLEAMQMKFWYLYGLMGVITSSFLRREDYTPDMSIFSFSTMFVIYILLILQAYKDEKSPGGIKLILTTSYTRKDFIIYQYFKCIVYTLAMTFLNFFYTIFVLNYPRIINFMFFTKVILVSFPLIAFVVPFSLICNTGNSFVFTTFIFFLPYEIFCLGIGDWIEKIATNSAFLFILSIIVSTILIELSIIISKRIFLIKDL